MVPWAHPSPHPNVHRDRFNCFSRVYNHDRPRYSVCNMRLHLSSTVMQPNNAYILSVFLKMLLLLKIVVQLA